MKLFNDMEQQSYEQRISSGETVRALWWKQPYASAMLHGKEYETRTRPTNVRGLVLICSTIRPYTAQELEDISGPRQKIGPLVALAAGLLPMGKAIAVGELIDSFPMKPGHEDKAFVEYHPSRWCWKFANVRPIEPFPLPGKQGWSIIDDETRSKIKFV